MRSLSNEDEMQTENTFLLHILPPLSVSVVIPLRPCA